MRLISIAVLCAVATTASAFAEHKPKEAKIPSLVILKEQADLSHADELSTREEKGRYVYDQLRSVALASQGPLVEFLKSKGADFQRFYISNMIAVYDATPALIADLTARPDVARVIDNATIKLKLPKVRKPLDEHLRTSPDRKPTSSRSAPIASGTN